MSELAMLQSYLALGAILFGLGLAGFLIRRNLIVIFLCAEMMLQGVSLSLIAWGRYHDAWDGQMLVIFIICVAACEAGVALVLVLMLAQRAGNLDIASWQQSREEGWAPFVDKAIPEELEEDEIWPSLTPAGVQPDVDPADEMYRTRV
jgi:NADH-quinone oxidoreductase subunit K